jgi:hypothetical protein
MTDDRKSMDDFLDKVKTYADQYNLHCYKAYKEPYDLIENWTADSCWPDAGEQGVYAIFCADSKLLYVGKASFNGTIGRRLSTYFIDNPNGAGATTVTAHSWSRDPRYVLTVSVKNAWEAPSLEEYLIYQLNPIDNSQK